MSDDPTLALLNRLNQNINALGHAIEEVDVWIHLRGSADVSDRIDDHLALISANADFINKAMADLVTRCTAEEE